ncbi:hypothetical protein [Actinomadura verrucosospora]|uniref:Uncharacterized protein n=1 Tax=Actinomadura verrucosospora TaxID=46165 RepID=A0A7D3W3Z5_ACTVE|nr:hypothetical protein [Actinomadura verrucosospora]QKG25551.1 hypothetical protein ACTIVE_7203 [Actinomadura verrucosospora]
MRIPKRVNAVLDWMEQHFGALAVVVALVIVALVATLAPALVGLPVAGFVIGIAAGGFLVHVRLTRRIARARAEVDDLLRENGALRHRNTVLASGVISRGAQETQALVAIPEDDEDLVEDDPTRTAALPELTDELLGGDPGDTLGDGTSPGLDAEPDAAPAEDGTEAARTGAAKGGPAADEADEDTAGNARKG